MGRAARCFGPEPNSSEVRECRRFGLNTTQWMVLCQVLGARVAAMDLTAGPTALGRVLPVAGPT